MTRFRLILGSGSPQRRQLLSQAGYSFEIVEPGKSAECGICSSGGPVALVSDLAQRKAADVASQLDTRDAGEPVPSLIIACDTVAECGGAVLGKPQDEQDARRMLQSLSGELHRVYSGLCLWPYHISSAACGVARQEHLVIRIELAGCILSMEASRTSLACQWNC